MVAVEPQTFRTNTELEVFRKEILRLTNAERAKQGLAAFKSDAALDKVGDARAGEIIRFYSDEHLQPDKRKSGHENPVERQQVHQKRRPLYVPREVYQRKAGSWIVDYPINTFPSTEPYGDSSLSFVHDEGRGDTKK